MVIIVGEVGAGESAKLTGGSKGWDIEVRRLIRSRTVTIGNGLFGRVSVWEVVGFVARSIVWFSQWRKWIW